MPKTEFGRNLARKRKQSGFTQKALAGLCATSIVSLSNYETGNAFPGEQILRRICKRLNCKASDLLGF